MLNNLNNLRIITDYSIIICYFALGNAENEFGYKNSRPTQGSQFAYVRDCKFTAISPNPNKSR